MSFLTVSHRTIYRYREPVVLGEHRMMFRPRESHDLRLIHSSLLISPEPAQLRWLHDPFDNSVAIATFEGATTALSFESTVTRSSTSTALSRSIHSKTTHESIRFAIRMKTCRISHAL